MDGKNCKYRNKTCIEKSQLTERLLRFDPLLPPRKQLREEIIRQRVVSPRWLVSLPLIIPYFLQSSLLLRIRILPGRKRYDFAILSV